MTLKNVIVHPKILEQFFRTSVLARYDQHASEKRHPAIHGQKFFPSAPAHLCLLVVTTLSAPTPHSDSGPRDFEEVFPAPVTSASLLTPAIISSTRNVAVNPAHRLHVEPWQLVSDLAIAEAIFFIPSGRFEVNVDSTCERYALAC